jgi:hypothetical protein
VKSGDTAQPFFTSELDGGEWSALSTRKDKSVPSVRGCVGPTADLDVVEKRNGSYLCWESNLCRPDRSQSLFRLTYIRSNMEDGGWEMDYSGN